MQEVGRFRVGRRGTQPHNRGDHDKARRTVGERIGVDKCSVFNWGTNTVSPDIRCMPAIIRFLGYNPLPAADTLSERLVRQRTSLGLSQKEAAKCIGVDPSTLARWECGDRGPTVAFLARVQGFISDEVDPLQDSRSVG